MDPKNYEKTVDYHTFWTGAGKEYVDKLEKAIVCRSLPGGDSIAEIGAGYGRLADCYFEKYRKVHLVEPAQNLRKMAEDRFGKKASYHDADVYQLPFPDASFDAVVMVRVMHHLVEPQKALAEITRVLKPGGVLVFNFSNKINPNKIAAFLLKRGSNPFSREPARYGEFLYGHHPQWMESILISLGFEIKKKYGTGFIDKLINKAPFRTSFIPALLLPSRIGGALRLSPALFVIALKK